MSIQLSTCSAPRMWSRVQFALLHQGCILCVMLLGRGLHTDLAAIANRHRIAHVPQHQLVHHHARRGHRHIWRLLQLRHCQPSKVMVDPYRAFGHPIFTSSRTRVRDVANMLNVGEDPQVVADEHGVSVEDVRTAARVLLGHAA